MNWEDQFSLEMLERHKRLLPITNSYFFPFSCYVFYLLLSVVLFCCSFLLLQCTLMVNLITQYVSGHKHAYQTFIKCSCLLHFWARISTGLESWQKPLKTKHSSECNSVQQTHLNDSKSTCEYRDSVFTCGLTECISDYIAFCTDSIVPTQTVHC